MDKKAALGAIKTWWSQIATLLAIAGSLITGYNYVDEKLDALERGTVDIAQLKDALADLRREQAVTNQRLTDSMLEGRTAIVAEFSRRDDVDEELRRSVVAVLNEMRARHGVITLAQPSPSIQAAQAQSDQAMDRAETAVTHDALSGINGL